MIKERIQSKGDDLKMLQGHDRLAYLIDIAKDVESLPQEVKIDQNRIRGCASNLWLIGGAKEDNTMIYKIDADAFITKGTAKLVTDLCNGCPREEIKQLNLKSNKYFYDVRNLHFSIPKSQSWKILH